jgi:hypothetical protein
MIIAMLLCSSTNGFAGTVSKKVEILILKEDWFDLKLGYTYAQALPILKSAMTAGSLFIVGMSDIESYHWTQQSITLTEEATDKLIPALPRERDLKKHVQYMTKVKKEHGWGNLIESALHLKGFLVTCNDELIYAGIFLEPMSEVASRYPVIRPGMSERKAVLNILPVQIPFVAYDPNSNDIAVWTAAIAPEGVKTWSQFPIAMKSKFISIGSNQEALEFRKIIRNERIREIMINTNKLR